jgi:hypothetical protein
MMKEEASIPQLNPRRDDIIQRILLNAENFPAHYPFITDRASFQASLLEKTAASLTDLLETMEKTRTVNNFAAQMKQVFFVASRATEVLGKKIRLKTDGLADNLMKQQQELDYIFKELAISYSESLSKASKPELRLAMLCGMAVLQTDAQNRLREAIQKKPEETFSDL